jgi:hypothetical protein
MKTVYVRLLTSLFVLAAFAAGARAQAVDQISITLDHEFVVAGKTLPAGTYKVFRASSSNTRELVINSVENHTGAIVIATDVEPNQNLSGTRARFAVTGDQYVLTQLQTLEHVFTIPVSKSRSVEVAATQPAKTTASASVGAN